MEQGSLVHTLLPRACNIQLRPRPRTTYTISAVFLSRGYKGGLLVSWTVAARPTSSNVHLSGSMRFAVSFGVYLACLRVLSSQGHVFEGWPEAGTNDDGKRQLMDQSIVLDAKYPGGLSAYVTKVLPCLELVAIGSIASARCWGPFPGCFQGLFNELLFRFCFCILFSGSSKDAHPNYDPRQGSSLRGVVVGVVGRGLLVPRQHHIFSPRM